VLFIIIFGRLSPPPRSLQTAVQYDTHCVHCRSQSLAVSSLLCASSENAPPAFRRHRKTNKSCGVELSVEDCVSWQEKSRKRLAPCKTSAPASLPLRLHDAVASTTAAVVCILGLIFDFLNTTAGFYRCTTAVRAVITSVSVETTMRCDQWRRQGGKGKLPPPLWVDVQKLCNMCVLSSSWNFFVSHDKYIARPSSKRATLTHRQYNRDRGTSYSRPPIDPYFTSPPVTKSWRRHWVRLQ